MERLSLAALRSFSGVAAIDLHDPGTALMLIDMQRRLVRPDGFTVERLRERGLDAAADQYLAQMAIAIPNMRRLLEAFRGRAQPVVHVMTSPIAGAGGGFAVTGSPSVHELAIIDELAPSPGETVVAKACSGVFVGTNVDYVLRRLGVRALVVVGCVTDGCVEQAIRQAHDLGYACVLVSDGCAALTDEIHADALERLEHRRAHVRTTAQVLSDRSIPATTVTTPDAA